jgi:maltodextrin utilization protein YvdJ
MPEATTDDVRGVINTELSDSEIDNYLNDAEFEAGQAIANYSTDLNTEERTQLEKYLASLLIRTTKDRSISSTSRETASVSYEGMSTSELRKRVDARDPSGTLANRTDQDRYVNSGP